MRSTVTFSSLQRLAASSVTKHCCQPPNIGNINNPNFLTRSSGPKCIANFSAIPGLSSALCNAVLKADQRHHCHSLSHHSGSPCGRGVNLAGRIPNTQQRTPNFPGRLAPLLAFYNQNRRLHTGKMDEDIIFRQLLEYKSYTYTYLLADTKSMEGVLIDPVIETVERDVRMVRDLGVNLVYAVNTHVHADHVTGTGELKKRLPNCKSMIAEVSEAKADIKLKEGDKIPFGRYELDVRSTPGHTNGCMTYVWQEKGMVFTGDALLIRGCGRTDFQQGNAGKLYDSVHNKIFSLPQHFRVFPAHDYTGQMMSTVGEESRFNPRLTKTKSEFIEVMQKLNLPYPKQIDKALPANMVCGIYGDDGKLVT